MQRNMAFIIFFTIVMAIYFSANYYVFARGLQALPPGHGLRPWFPWVFWGVASLYVAGRFLEKWSMGTASDLLIWSGSIWLAALLYLFLLVLLYDILRLANHLLPFFPDWITAHMVKTRLVLFAGTVAVVAALVTGGAINARHPRIRSLDLRIPKSAGVHKELHAVVMSDIHLGTVIGKHFLGKVVEKVDRLGPDIILIAGDILDEDLGPVLRQDAGRTLERLHAPLGVWAIMGNHEHIGGSAGAVEFLTRHGITLLRDSVAWMDGFTLVGREDRDKARFSGTARKSLEELLEKVDLNHPVILLDHQPYYLEEAAALGVDLQLSGHTHHGQLWPLNAITSALFPISKGYGKIGNMHAYVSNGLGTWGPPVRIGNRPEIVSLRIRFE
jgi:hypothetical protein